jgi:hypothetical protein
MNKLIKKNLFRISVIICLAVLGNVCMQGEVLSMNNNDQANAERLRVAKQRDADVRAGQEQERRRAAAENAANAERAKAALERAKALANKKH